MERNKHDRLLHKTVVYFKSYLHLIAFTENQLHSKRSARHKYSNKNNKMQCKFQLILFGIILILFSVSCKSDVIRPKRTLSYFFDGLLSAFNEKHRSQTSSSTLAGLAKLSTFSTKNVDIDSGESSSIETVQVPIPSQKPPTRTSATQDMPTKVRLPLMVENSTTTKSTSSTTSTTTTAEPATESLETTTPAETTTDISTNSADSGETTISSPTLSPELNELDSNHTGAEGRSLPLYGERSAFRATSGRHTQFFGNPMILEQHRDYHVPLYYDELVIGTANDVVPRPDHFYQAPKYLPVAAPPPVIVVPIENSIPAHIEHNHGRTEPANYHSHVKVQHGNYHYYTYHGTGDSPAPILSLRRVHMTQFGRRNDCDHS